MLLTKSDFLRYRECPSNAWFTKNKPAVLKKQPIDPFVQGLIDQGAEVETWAQKRFPGGVHVRSFQEQAVETTERLIAEGKKTIYQATFSDGELYAMIDILEWNDLFQGWDIIEVKSSSSQQDQLEHRHKDEHIDDAGFQRILLQRLGMKVVNVYLVQLNKEYIKDGEIDLEKLFAISEITDKLFTLEDSHKEEIKDAVIALKSKKEPTACFCRYKARNRQCSSFDYLYPDTPKYAVYDLNRIGLSKKQLEIMVDEGILAMSDIKDVSKFNKMKLWQWQTYIENKEIIQQGKIKEELSALEYPLYFLDYETLPSAIPKYDNTWPHHICTIQQSTH